MSRGRKVEERLEKIYLIDQNNFFYIPLADDPDIKWKWTGLEVAEFEELWEKGIGPREQAEHFKCDPDDIAIMIIDRARKGFIEPWDERMRPLARKRK